jgi:hypothetical protein
MFKSYVKSRLKTYLFSSISIFNHYPGFFCPVLENMEPFSKNTLPDDDNPKRADDYSQHKSCIQLLSPSTQLDDDVYKQSYAGHGTNDDPYVIDFLRNDRQNAMSFSKGRKWGMAVPQALSFFAVTFGSSVYASGIPEVMQRFHVSQEVATLGIALYVLGFALGPILWAPMSEVYGRRLTFMISYAVYMAFTVASPCAPNIAALLVLRFFAGAFGASAQTNPGGMIADMFSKEERGPVMAIFAASPFLGPAFGMSWASVFLAAIRHCCSCTLADSNQIFKVPLSAALLEKNAVGAGFSASTP